MFLRSHIWWITTGCDCGVLHPTFERFAFVSLVSLNYFIFMHYSYPLVFLGILYPKIDQFLNEFLLDITVGSRSARSHDGEHLDMKGIASIANISFK